MGSDLAKTEKNTSEGPPRKKEFSKFSENFSLRDLFAQLNFKNAPNPAREARSQEYRCSF